jgi:hypothetical protein
VIWLKWGVVGEATDISNQKVEMIEPALEDRQFVSKEKTTEAIIASVVQVKS